MREANERTTGWITSSICSLRSIYVREANEGTTSWISAATAAAKHEAAARAACVSTWLGEAYNYNL